MKRKKKVTRTRKTYVERPPVAEPKPSPHHTNISDCTFINGEAGKVQSPECAAAVEKLAEAIIACAVALRGTQPGSAPNGTAIEIKP